MHVDTNSHKLKVDQKIFGFAWPEMCLASPGHGTLKLAVSQEWIDGMNWFFAWWCKFRKAKSYFNGFWVGLVKNGCSQSGHGTGKLTVSQNWTDEITWILHASTNARRLKVDSVIFECALSKIAVAF